MSWKYLNKSRSIKPYVRDHPLAGDHEKSTLGSNSTVTFKVPLDATKPEIRAAVEGLFEVKVKAVNTLRQG